MDPGENGLLRVVVLSPSAELGGAEHSLLTFLKEAGRHNVQPTVLMPREGPLARELSRIGVSWQVVPQPRALLSQSRNALSHSVSMMVPLLCQAPRYLARLAGAVRRARPHVIYTNGVKCHVLGALLRPVLRISTVWHARVHWHGALAGRMADVGADLIIANSHSTARALRRTMRSRGKLVVIHNAVDLKAFHPKGPLADVAPVPPGAPKVALPGAFASLKGHQLLLRAATKVWAQLPSTRFFFIGGAIYDTVANRRCEAELHRTVANRGLTDRVHFTGLQDNIAPWFRAMDVVVNASVRPEGFGRTLLEAMACGRAVVGPDAGGVPEFVQHRRNGLLYPMGNANALADAILTLMGSPDLRRRLGAAGRRTAAARFGMEAHARAVANALRSVAVGEGVSELLRLPRAG